MKARQYLQFLLILMMMLFLFSCTAQKQEEKISMGINKSIQTKTVQNLIEKFGNDHKARIEKGVEQVAEKWKNSDGSETDFQEFCLNNFFIGEDLTKTTEKFQKNLESLYGNLHKISRDYSWAIQVEVDSVHTVDYMFANYSAFAHIKDDFFKTKLAFVILLNYPLETLELKNQEGMNWSREKWAEVRLAEYFSDRVPAEISQKVNEAYVAADDYISNYNIYMHHLLDTTSKRLFPEGLKLITHWGLRDELKSHYANPDGFVRQKMIQKVMERIILQEIPEVLVNNDKYDWNPYDNKVYKANSEKVEAVNAEPDTRYKHLHSVYKAEKLMDPYRPDAPSKIDRRFKEDREMLEAEVEGLLKDVLTAPALKDIAALIKKRLGRELEPFDIWYRGFKPKTEYNEEELDKILKARYPSVAAFQEGVPTILRKLGFSREKAKFLNEHIQVDPSRGAGHASGAMMKDDKAHLRTRIPEGGMKYKGYNIAVHELGHNVEQVFSLNGMDYYTLNGVPNTAFTEGFAFVFQARDLQLLGVSGKSEQAEALDALNTLWATMEISGVALVDMYIWRWMYEYPEADAAMLKQAMTSISKQVWNDYFAPLFGHQDQILLGIYSHIIYTGLYTPDYPVGHIIYFQIEQYFKDKSLATEMERMCRLGRLSPQIWMQKAVGEKVSALPMIKAAEEALKIVTK